MKVYSFGGANPTAYYTFPQVNSSEEWETLQPQVAIQLAGSSGQYDFYPYAGGLSSIGGHNPISPYLITKRFDLVADTYTDLEDNRYEILEDVVNMGMRRLHFVDRDGNYKWAHARCVRFLCTDASDGRQFRMPTEVTMFCPEGVMYYSYDTDILTSNGAFSVANDGNYPGIGTFSIDSDTGTISKVVIQVGVSYHKLTWDDTGGTGVTAGKTLTIDARTYTVDIDGVDAYDKFTVEGVAPYYITTVPWIVATGGGAFSGTLTVTSTGTWTATFTMYDTWRL